MAFPNWRDCLAPIIGRILVGGYFLWSGIYNALNFDATLAALQTITYLHVLSPFFIAVGAVAVQVVAGTVLVIGWRTRLAAGVLACYVIAASLFLHSEAFNQALTSFELLKNFAIAGGLLYMSAYGSGQWALEAKRRR